MNIKHRRDLWKLINEPGPAAEIGVAEGNFSRDILSWPGGRVTKIYMVDRWASVPSMKGDSSSPQEWHESNLIKAQEQVAPFTGRYVFLRGDSADMARVLPPVCLSLLYIDADHSYEGVMRDLIAWVPKVREGGVVAMHDYEAPQYGVKRAVTEFCAKHNFQINLLPEDKAEDAGAWFRVC